ncbi:MAG: hypothetical protein R3B93_06525 [Bacteroidia bacterium]
MAVRCIQSLITKAQKDYEKEISERFESGEIFDQSKIEVRSLKYTTTSGRTVYGGGGIYPDIFVADDTTGNSKYFTDLRIKDMFRQFSFDYVDNRPDLIKKYKTPEEFVEKFPVTQDLIDQFTAFATDKGVKYNPNGYNRSKKYIDNRIKAYIGRHLHNDLAFYPVFHQLDNVIQRAVELMPTAHTLEETGKLGMKE